MENSTKILVCDENSEERTRLIEILTKSSYRCEGISDGRSALALLNKENFDVVIIDLWLSGLDGIGLLRAAQKIDFEYKPSFILMSPLNKQKEQTN